MTTTLKSIPFSKLVASDAINARTVGGKDGLDELAASIAAKGLIQGRGAGTPQGPREGARMRLVNIKQSPGPTADNWNRARPIGTRVRMTRNGAPLETTTAGRAWSLSTGRAVVPLVGVKGCVPCDQLTVIDGATA